MKCGLLGRKLGHSYSPEIHRYMGSYFYCLFEVEPDDLERFIREEEFDGLNVTMPYKKAVIPYLDDLTPIAKQIGAVNTIYRKNGKLVGHNTDFYGFQQMLAKSGLSPNGKKCLVLGSGGASDVAVAALREQGANVVVISRSGKDNYDNLHLHKDVSIIVNATPVGMYPHCGESPLDLELFPQLEGVLDVIYNPARTQLLMEAQARNLVTENGLWMLVCQAQEASEKMTGIPVSNDQAKFIYHHLQRKMENIVLIGMPGCGKSTIGKALAERTGKRFVDTDAYIQEIAGKSIPEIFAEEGEEVFRDYETAAIKMLGQESGLIVATGGGCVTKERNYPLLHQNATIVWICRPLDQLSTDGRPLSLKTPLYEMYTQRKPLYESFADIHIDNSAAVESTLNAILEKFL